MTNVSREGMAKYWFSARRRGLGWGRPVAWQGWLVVIAFGALVAAGGLLLPPRQEWLLYLGYIAILIVLLIGLGWLKTEPTGWRSRRD
jgi:hypothetical protein